MMGCNLQLAIPRFQAFSLLLVGGMVQEVTVTIEVPDSVKESAEREAAAGGGDVRDHVVDRLDLGWNR